LYEKHTIDNVLNLIQEVLEFEIKELYPISCKKDSHRKNLIVLHHDHNSSSFVTIKQLLLRPCVTDIYTISRRMYESVITMGLLAKSLIEDDIERYIDFRFIEASKFYNHLKQLGLEKLSGIKDVSSLNKYKKDYCKKFGSPGQTWTGLTVVDNAQLVDKHYPITCNETRFYEYLYCQIYRNSSQITHSSFGGIYDTVEREEFCNLSNEIIVRYKDKESHLINTGFYSIIIFLSSVRFMGYILDTSITEEYFQEKCNWINSK